MSFFNLRNGGRLYYEDTGAGKKTIIMLHGWTSTSGIFSRSVPEISKAARCIVYDQRGHGKSRSLNIRADFNAEANMDTNMHTTMNTNMHTTVDTTMDTLAADLKELIEGLDLHDVVLLGWSMGAAVIMNYIALYGCHELRQIILCDMSPKQINDDEWKLGLYQGKYTRADMERGAGMDFYSLYREFALAAIPRLARVPEIILRRPLKRRIADCDEEVLRSLSLSMKEKDYRECVEKIEVPFSYFYAVPGSLFSPDLANWYKEHTHSRFHAVAFRKSTHMFVGERPKRFSREVVKVLRG